MTITNSSDIPIDFISPLTLSCNIDGSSGSTTGIVNSAHGGTGVNNGSNTITLGGNISTANTLTTSGNFPLTVTCTGTTTVTLPTSGTLATTTNTVSSITGSSNQVLANGTTGSAQTGAVTLTLPQFIGTTSTPQFGALTLSSSGSGLNLTNNSAISGQTIAPVNWNGQDSVSGSVIYGRLKNEIVSNTTGVTTSKTTLSVQNGSGTLTDYMNLDGSTEKINLLKTPNVSSLTASSLVATDSSKNLTSTTSGLTPTFTGLNLSGLTASSLVSTDGSKNLTTFSGQVPLANGGTNASLTANNGGIFYSTASAGAILAGTATAGKMLQSGSTAAPSWSTPTYPSASGTSGKILRSDGTNNVYTTSTFSDTYTASNLLYSNGSNTVTGLSTANNGTLVTNGSGVPSISSTLPSAVQNNITSLGTLSSIVQNSAQPLVISRLSSNITNATGNGVEYTIICDTADENVGSYYDTTTGIFTAGVTGNYLFTGAIFLGAVSASNTQVVAKVVTGSRSYQVFSVNGANVKDINNSLCMGYSIMIHLISSGTVTVTITAMSGTQTVSVKGVAPQITYFDAYLLS